MTVNQLIEELLKVPEDYRDAPVRIVRDDDMGTFEADVGNTGLANAEYGEGRDEEVLLLVLEERNGT